MSLNKTPAAERVHIGFFGKRNAGKSSVMNAVTAQNLSVVSPIKGTTTDPVHKSMELLPLGPVVMMDTPGMDDEGELGGLRVKKSQQSLNRADIAILVIDGTLGPAPEDFALLQRIQRKGLPYLIAANKADLVSPEQQAAVNEALAGAGIPEKAVCWMSALTGEGIEAFKEALPALLPPEEGGRTIVRDLLSPGDVAVLVVPIDKAAPKGRLILPQQQTIRDILEAGAIAAVARDTELQKALRSLGKPPRMVITDSQAFEAVSAITPLSVPLTSFSILFARYKGNLEAVVRGVRALDSLQDGDRVLISEGCTHHRQCEDIGTVKLPGWIRKYTGKAPEFEFTSGTEFPEDLTKYHMVVHCGGCMLNEREMKYRLSCAADQNVPMTNYGILIAYMQGILRRSVALFPEVYALLPEE